MSDSRTTNTTRNIVAGLVYKTITIVMPFINRTAILWLLGAEFTGLSTLFTSILGVLGIAELGFNSAVVYSLYRPMAERDEEEICRIVTVLRRVYTAVGTFIFCAGLCLMPFIKMFIKGSYPAFVNIYILYFLYLLISSVSYFMFAYKECLLIADQRQDIATAIRTVVNAVRYITQLAVLLIFRDFYYYLIVTLIGTVVTNLAINYATKKRFPFFKLVSGKSKIPSAMVTQVQGLLIGRICDTFRNSFDSLIISSFIGLTATAIYGNYYLIYSSLYAVMLVICDAMGPSVGNSIIERTESQNFSDLETFSALFSWILAWCTVCMFCLYQPFMELWAGQDLLLSDRDMALFCVYFYAINMNNIRNQYISGTGIWWKLKAAYIVEAVGNLFLNFVLGKFFGIAGVLWATIITIFCFNYLLRNEVLFRNYFRNENLFRYECEQFLYAAYAVVACMATYVLCDHVRLGGIYELLARSCICVVVPNILLMLGYAVSPRRKDMASFVKRHAAYVIRK